MLKRVPLAAFVLVRDPMSVCCLRNFCRQLGINFDRPEGWLGMDLVQGPPVSGVPSLGGSAQEGLPGHDGLGSESLWARETGSVS